MADKKISALDTDSAPDRGNDYVPTYDASAVATKKVLLDLLGVIPLWGGFTNSNPADATTYYFGPFVNQALITGDSTYVWPIPRAGIITQVRLVLQGAGGSAETSTLYIRKNGTTDTTVTSTFATNTGGLFNYTGLSVSVAAGDYVGMKWVAPTWATNPTGLHMSILLLLE